MWTSFTNLMFRNRVAFLIALGLLTAFMSYQTSQIQLSYEFARPLPKEDSTLIAYDNFKKMFGEDGAIMVIGIQDSSLYQLEKFKGWYNLTHQIKAISGIQNTLSVANLYNVQKDDSLQKFKIKPVAATLPTSQKEVDSISKMIHSLPFYKGLLYNPENHATAILITFNKKDLNSKNRLALVHQIVDLANQFSTQHKVKVYFSGMPYIRAHYMETVSREMVLFMFLAILVSLLIVFQIFKSPRIAVYSLIVVLIGIVCSLGTLVALGYKITILSGMIPPIITVIGLPNCVFIINKYLTELEELGDKDKAVYHSFSKVVLSNFLANVTTAIGFFVFYFTNSSLLVEFGVVASINVLLTFAVAHILIPILLSYSPIPPQKQMVHLNGKIITKVLNKVISLITNYKKVVYLSLTVLTVISIFGWHYIKLLGYVVDDLPKSDKVYTDLRFFEKNFNGVLPFEVSIDTKKENGVFADNARTLYKIKALEKMMSNYKEFSKPVSVVSAIKFAYQSYNEGKEKYYILPDEMRLKDLQPYTESMGGNATKFGAFMDSTKRYTRVTFQMADVGSIRMKELNKEIRLKVDSIFPPAQYKVELTGNSLVFLKGNDYLFHHLFVALFIAIGLILLLGMCLFRSIAIIFLSKLPCLIPLAITAGIMGYFGIPFKPSTIIVFTIAYSLSSDGTIYILTEYWSQLRKGANKNGTHEAITKAVREVGISMLYTSSILFCGFMIFIASSFGGTVALGVLMSITIAVSLFTNLVLLPSILLSLELFKEKREQRKLAQC